MKHKSKVGLSASIALVTTALMLTAPAFAGNGNGNGGGAGKGGGQKAERVSGKERSALNKGGQRGALASALGSLNAANANPKALANASPDSMPGKLFIYQQTGGITVAQIGAINDARDALGAIDGLDADALLASYDANGDGLIDEVEQAVYEGEVAAAKESYDALIAEDGDAYAALGALQAEDAALTLSKAALDELNRMLGL